MDIARHDRRIARELLIGLVLLVVTGAAAAAGGSLPASRSGPPWIGVSWPLEQESEERWERDLAGMQAAHLNVVRVGEEAWSRLEPYQDHYDLQWLRRAIQLAARHHIAVIIRAPTDVPPRWLQADASAAAGGPGRVAPLSSLWCRDRGLTLLDRLAQGLGHESNVLGWELGTQRLPAASDPVIRSRLLTWLLRRYGTPGALEAAWGVSSPAGAYAGWEALVGGPQPASPDYQHDWQQFVADARADLEGLQARVIRRHVQSGQMIMATAVAAAGDGVDGGTARDPGGIAWLQDLSSAHQRPIQLAIASDVMRSLGRRGLWLTEPLSLHHPQARTRLDAGELRGLAWELVGHGAEGLLLAPVRSGPDDGGSVLGTAAYAGELRQLAQELRLAAPVLKDTSPRAQVAILVGGDQRWARAQRRCSAPREPQQALLHFYRPLRQLAGPVDIVGSGAPLDRYRVVIAPDPGVLSASLARHLGQYVLHGGRLILGPGAALAADAAATSPIDVLFGEQGGGCHELAVPLPVVAVSGSGSAGIWGEDLSVSAAHGRVLLRYGAGDSPLSGKAAAVLLQRGRGAVIRLGAVLDPALTSAFLQSPLAASGALSRFGPLPPDVEWLPRTVRERQIIILVNHGDGARSVLLPARMRDVLNRWRRVRQVSLPAHGVAVLATSSGMRP